MQAMGFECAEMDNPYAAAAELHRRPMVYRALVLSLASLFREELAMVAALKRKLPHIEIWLTHIEGRQAAMAETMRMGADGLLDEDGVLHRMSVTTSEAPKATEPIDEPPQPESSPSVNTMSRPLDLPADGEPVLSADELKALLAENPAVEEETDAT